MILVPVLVGLQVLAVNLGTQAEQHSELHAGMKLLSIAGESTAGVSDTINTLVHVQMLQMATNHTIRVCEPLSGWAQVSYEDVIAMLKGAHRPVSLTFRIADRAAPSQAVTFAQDGSLGIKFTPKDGRIEILQVGRSGCIVLSLCTR